MILLPKYNLGIAKLFNLIHLNVFPIINVKLIVIVVGFLGYLFGNHMLFIYLLPF